MTLLTESIRILSSCNNRKFVAERLMLMSLRQRPSERDLAEYQKTTRHIGRQPSLV